MTDYFIDIGNTRIKYTPSRQPFSLTATRHDALAPLFAAITTDKPEKLWLTAGRSDAAQQALSQIVAFAEAQSTPLEIVSVRPDMLAVNYRDSEQFGVDRFLHLLAGKARYRRDFCVVSAGTAIALDFYTDHHIGGMILLGLGSAKVALAEKTGLHEFAPPTETLLGHDTASSIGAGLYVGYQNLIDRSIVRIGEKHQTTFTTLLTGGDAATLYPENAIAEDLLFLGMAQYKNLFKQEAP